MILLDFVRQLRASDSFEGKIVWLSILYAFKWKRRAIGAFIISWSAVVSFAILVQMESDFLFHGIVEALLKVLIYNGFFDTPKPRNKSFNFSNRRQVIRLHLWIIVHDRSLN